MCLIIFNWQPNSQRPLILAANRDEFHMRPSLDAHFWEDNPKIFAGRDLEKKGTWLGLAKNDNSSSFRLSALTNFRSTDNNQYKHSRGEITQHFLETNLGALEYAQQIPFSLYAGFNALFFDGTSLIYCHYESHQTPDIYILDKGIYGLSNAKLNSPWPKVEKTKIAFQSLAGNEIHEQSAKNLFHYLRDNKLAEDSLLPETGVGIELERMLSPAFIISPSYGTRTASLVIVDVKENQQSVYFNERQFSNKGEHVRELIKRLN
ncbi:MAG: hypothetical protein ACI8O8_001892 [Oleiphilaceae bacterium]|jgi:uncharacterized protein with NRDE domain